MPKANTMLDELARVLKARHNAMMRFDRRAYGGRLDEEAQKSWGEAAHLIDNLDDRAVMEYDRLMRSNPGRRDMQKAFRMMPGELVREHDYFDR